MLNYTFYFAPMNCTTGQPLSHLWKKTLVCCSADGPGTYFQEASASNNTKRQESDLAPPVLFSNDQHNSSKWQLNHTRLTAHVDSVKVPLIYTPHPPTKERRSRGKNCSTITAALRSTHRWLPKERQPVAGFRGRRDAAVPIWLPKQLWGLICPTPPQRRGCNSIASWPTVLPFAGAKLLRKCPGKCPVAQKACRLSNSHSACPFFSPPPLLPPAF